MTRTISRNVPQSTWLPSLVALALLVLLGGAGRTWADAPQQIRLTTTDDPRTSVTVSFVTTSQIAPTVRYGIDQVNLTEYAVGMSAPVPHSSTGIQHWVTLTGLTPGRTYYYQCGTVNDWSGVRTFETSPNDRRPFQIDIYGDTGAGNRFDTLMTSIAADQPQAMVHLGGMAYASGLSGTWDNFSRTWSRAAARCITGAVLGDEEYETLLGTYIGNSTFMGRMLLPGNKMYYSYKWGHLLLVFYNTEEDISEGSPQYNWLESVLAGARVDPETTFVATFGHRPIYSTGGRYGSQPDLEHLSVLFDRYGVHLSFSAHERMYERTWPLLGGNTTSTDQRDVFYAVPGTIYVVSGGGGQGLDSSFGTSQPWSRQRFAQYHYVTLEVEPALWTMRLFARAYDTGNILDSATITISTPTNTPTQLVIDTPTPSPTRTPIKTPDPTETPTSSPSDTPFVTPTSSPTNTGTPTPNVPEILLAGYWNTRLKTASDGTLTMIALLTDPNIAEVELLYEGIPTGLKLYDDGFHSDFGRRDGVFGIQWPVAQVKHPASVRLDLVAKNTEGVSSGTWPFLNVERGPTSTATPTRTPTVTPTPTALTSFQACKLIGSYDRTTLCSRPLTSFCGGIIRCTDSSHSVVVRTNYLEQGDVWEIAWRRDFVDIFVDGGTVAETCTDYYLKSTFTVDDLVLAACDSDWRVEFRLNGRTAGEEYLTITTTGPNCQCD